MGVSSSIGTSSNRSLLSAAVHVEGSGDAGAQCAALDSASRSSSSSSSSPSTAGLGQRVVTERPQAVADQPAADAAAGRAARSPFYTQPDGFKLEPVEVHNVGLFSFKGSSVGLDLVQVCGLPAV